MANSIQNLLSTDIQSVMLPNKHRNLIECKVCGASARYSYFGAIVCESCKMFFKRNAELEPVNSYPPKEKQILNLIQLNFFFIRKL